MKTYDDLRIAKGSGTPYDKLTHLPNGSEVYPSANLTPPVEYLDFLVEIGWGELGNSAYMLYNGLVEPQDIYEDASGDLNSVLLFGDDFQGYGTGFNINDWSIVEVDPINVTTSFLSSSFAEFIRAKITELTC